MKLLLLCLGLTLVCAHFEKNRDIVKCNFNMSQISGEWHTIFLASGRMRFIRKNGGMRMFAKSMEALHNSSLLFKYDKQIDGECTELTFITDETKEKGVYNVTYDGHNTFYIIEAVYNDYVIFHNMNFGNGRKTDVIEMNARKPDVRPELKERFEEICRNRGIPEENILDTPVPNPEGSLEPQLPGGNCLVTGSKPRGSSECFLPTGPMSSCDKYFDLISSTVVEEGMISESSGSSLCVYKLINSPRIKGFLQISDSLCHTRKNSTMNNTFFYLLNKSYKLQL